MWRWLLIGFVAMVVVCGGGGYAFTRSPQFAELQEKMKGQEQAIAVLTKVVSRGDLTRSVNAPGRIEPETIVQVSARVSAQITALPFEELDSVKKDDVVARLDAADVEARLESAQAQLLSEQARLLGAQADVSRAEANAERQRTLFETGDVTEAVLEEAESSLKRAQSNLKVVEHSIDIARASIRQREKDLDNTVIRAPMDGVIVRLNSKVGETVLGTANNAGTVIMEIADLDEMLMRAEVDESNVAPVEAGQRATVYVNAYPDMELQGVVERVKLVRQVSSRGAGYFETEIRLEVPEGEQLQIGLTSNCDIHVETLYDVTKIPSQAVVDRRVEDLPTDIVGASNVVDRARTFTRVVYRLVDGRAVATPVSIGPSDLSETVILAGLEEGAEVIIGPYRALIDMKHDALLTRRDGGDSAEADADEAAEPAETPGAS